MTAANRLLANIEKFLARKDVNLSETTFGKLAVNDGKFVGRLRAGGGLTLATADKIALFMSKFPDQAKKKAAA